MLFTEQARSMLSVMWFGRALRSRSGGVAILAALCLPIMVAVLGLAIDYGYASYVNQLLTRASDAAALTAVSQAAATAVGGYANVTDLKSYGQKVFLENIKNTPASGASLTLTVSQNGTNGPVTASASYVYNLPTFFGQLIGTSTMPLANSIVATALPPVYVNYYILVDVSNSMGIGATQADMAALYNELNARGFKQNSEKGCVFACHDANVGSNYTYTTESVAREIGVTLRIDSAIAAIKSIVSSAASIVGPTKNIKFGLYLLQADPNTGNKMTALSAPSTNYANLISLAGTIDLGDNQSQAVGDTDFQNELSTFSPVLTNTADGSGASATSPKNYVFLITDGVRDLLSNSCTTTACVSAIDPTLCNAIKTKATMGVIYTTYLEIWKDNDPTTRKYELLYDTYVKGIMNQIRPNLASCASSSDYFFEAVDGPSITTSMQALFAKTQPVTARLSQ